MTDRSEEELDRLLARGRMGAPGRERVLGKVLEAAAPRRSRLASWAGVLAFVSAGAVAATFLLVHGRVQPDGSFTSKGGTAGASPRVEASCIDGDPARCAIGSTLVFRAENCEAGGYLAAYAERAGSSGDTPKPPGSTDRIWYFPSKNDPTLPSIAPRAELQVLARGARIGSEHAPGPYVVTTILLAHPLTREQITEIAGATSPELSRRWTTPIEVTP